MTDSNDNGGEEVEIDVGQLMNVEDAASSVGPTDKRRQLFNELKESLKKALSTDSALQAEVASLDHYLSRAPGSSSKGHELSVFTGPPTPMARTLAQQVRRAATSFNDDSSKGLVRRRDHGRLKPMRYEIYDDLDIAYDTWEPGLDQEMFIGLLIDVSGSMSKAPISEVVHALEVGLSDVAETYTVLFSDSYYIPSVRNTVDRMVRIGVLGGTAPLEGLHHLKARVLESSAANRLVVMYTDGEFYHHKDETCTFAIDELKQQGVNVRILSERDQVNVPKLQRSLHLEDHEIIAAHTLKDLPDVVLDWTRTILTRLS